MDANADEFMDDLIESVRQMRRGEFARSTVVMVPEATTARNRLKLSQREFADLIGVSKRTVQDWEQGRRQPTGAARRLIQLAVKHPKLLRSLEL